MSELITDANGVVLEKPELNADERLKFRAWLLYHATMIQNIRKNAESFEVRVDMKTSDEVLFSLANALTPELLPPERTAG